MTQMHAEKKGVIYLKSVGHRGFLFPRITQMYAENISGNQRNLRDLR